MTRPNRDFSRLALVVALAASLGLTACGRKGPLDPPPGAQQQGQSQQAEPQPTAAGLLNPMAAPIGGQTTSAGAGVDADGRPMAPVGPKRSFPLDVLLN
ncbi:MAG: lipoprotein [Pseudolabrys sp.]|nr:lipoprotein [Pseudolabrys sp.]